MPVELLEYLLLAAVGEMLPLVSKFILSAPCSSPDAEGCA